MNDIDSEDNNASAESRYLQRVLGPLVGMTVVGLAVDNADDRYCGLHLARDGKHKTLWFLQDAEDNGPGWPQIIDLD